MKVVKHVKVNGIMVPVYAAKSERNLDINVNRIVVGVILGSMVLASAGAAMIF